MLKAKVNAPNPNPHILVSMNVLVRGWFENVPGARGPGDTTCVLFATLMAEEPRAQEWGEGK